MARDEAHGIAQCPDPMSCHRHKGNVIVQDEDQLLLVLKYAKRNDQPGQFPGGSVIEKQTWEPSDLHCIGSRGKVIGCLSVDGKRGYFVEWLDLPGRLAFIQEYKIRLAPPPGGTHVS